jgi:uncharacterized protein with PIN domain
VGRDFDIRISFQTMTFLVDRMLGKLAKELRMLGYDAAYYRGEDANQLIQLARQEGRTILTRSTKLIPKRSEDRILRVRADHPFLQLKELFQAGQITLDEEKFFSRCLICNVPLDQISKEKAEGKVPDFIFHEQKDFFRCPRCQRIYWQGSHQENMQKRMEELFKRKHHVECQGLKSK